MIVISTFFVILYPARFGKKWFVTLFRCHLGNCVIDEIPSKIRVYIILKASIRLSFVCSNIINYNITLVCKVDHKWKPTATTTTHITLDKRRFLFKLTRGFGLIVSPWSYEYVDKHVKKESKYGNIVSNIWATNTLLISNAFLFNYKLPYLPCKNHDIHLLFFSVTRVKNG